MCSSNHNIFETLTGLYLIVVGEIYQPQMKCVAYVLESKVIQSYSFSGINC